MTRSERYWYAQHLADAIHRRQWLTVEPRRIRTDKGPKMRTTGSKPERPRVLMARAPELPNAQVRPASLLIGYTCYQKALQLMTEEEREAWWDWLKRRKDLAGRERPAQALFRSHGGRVTQSEGSSRHEQAAALRVVDRATITQWSVV